VMSRREVNPEAIRVLDPACGSGHLLLSAYDVLKRIYLEWGYPPRAIPKLILENNLFGLDIDPRAIQLCSAALFMKWCLDTNGEGEVPRLNVYALHPERAFSDESLLGSLIHGDSYKATDIGKGFPVSVPPLLQDIHFDSEISLKEVYSFVSLFSEVNERGSLMTLPESWVKKLKVPTFVVRKPFV